MEGKHGVHPSEAEEHGTWKWEPVGLPKGGAVGCSHGVRFWLFDRSPGGQVEGGEKAQ